MKNISRIFLLTLQGLLPHRALRTPMRAAVWISTLVSICWAAADVWENKPGAHQTALMAAWISLTLILSTVCEAISGGITQSQTLSLKAARDGLKARRLCTPDKGSPAEEIAASLLRTDDFVIVSAGETIPSDGEVIAGIATVDESALTGESAPVIREAGGDRSAVTAGTRVLSDWIILKVRAAAGESFLDKMIQMVEGSKRQKTPTEISIEAVLTLLTVLFLALSLAIAALSSAWATALQKDSPFGVLQTIGFFLCLAPTTIGALLPIVSISGMLRLMKKNIIAKSAQAVEAAGNIDIMMLDKTGTITLGDRQAREFFASGISEREFAQEAQLSSLADTTPEGRSIVILAKEKFAIRQPVVEAAQMNFIGFTATTRMSGVDLPDRQLRKGAANAVELWLKNLQLPFPNDIRTLVNKISTEGGTPLVLANNKNGVRGVIALRDVIKGGLRERFAQLRKLKIETVMVTGDNPLTAAAVAAEAGVDRFVAEATPEMKLKMIRQLQSQGRMVAMSGDGTNDAPALAQADVALCMNSGTQPAKEAGNLIDLDSNPTKLIEVVQIGKQNLITIGALTTFSLSNDIAKFFTLMPAMFSGLFPSLKVLDVVGFDSPAQAMRVALIFNAVIIPLMLPLALSGTPRPTQANGLLARHLLIYGLGGAVAPLLLMHLIKLL